MHNFYSLNITGFGDIEPCSVWGQAFTILAAFFGIPLTLLCLTKLGFVFEIYLNKFWLFMRKRTKRNNKVYASDATKLSVIIEEDDEIEIDRTAIVVPIWFGLLVTFLWILFCSIYFYITLKPNYKQQNFTVFTAFYFTIITFFTIGLGDVAPTQYEYILITYLFILIGLALVTMCIDILQDKLDSLFDSMVKMINDQYQQSVIQGEDQQNMSQHVDDVKNNVKEMLKKGNNKSWMKHFMSKKDKRKLVEQYQNKAKMKVKGTQHDTVYEEKPTQHDIVYEEKLTQHDIVYEEKTTLTDVAYLDKDTMTDPILTLVAVQSIGINVRVSHLHAVGHLESLIGP